MNAAQRKRIATILSELETLRGSVEELQGEEQDKYDNMPESLQSSDRGESMEEDIECLTTAADSLQEAIDALQGIN